MESVARLRDFVAAMTQLCEEFSTSIQKVNSRKSKPEDVDCVSPAIGASREFISGYHNTAPPNLWDRSKE